MLTPTLCVLITLLVTSSFLLNRRRNALPPGPLALPFVGNILNTPRKHPWKVYAKWSSDHRSDLISLQTLGATVIIINDIEVVHELFTRRAALYSDRMSSTVFDMMNLSRLLVFQSYGQLWTRYRRLFKLGFEADTHSTRHGHQLDATRRLLRRLLTTSDHQKDIQLAAGDAILSIIYGIKPTSGDDEYITRAEELVRFVADIALAGFLVDRLPFLKLLPSWIPGADFKNMTRRGAELLDKTLRLPFEHVREAMIKGTAVSSVCSRYMALLDNIGTPDEEQIEDMKNILGTAYLGGADTSFNQLCSFFLAMSLYPEVQKKAQDALDSALHGRLPEFSDYGKIPYIDAVVNETLRWNPMLPMGGPHILSKDDHYGGYFLPKGSICLPNVWAIFHNEKLYGPNTDEFVPERFLTADGQLNASVASVDAAFGFGKRICPGRVIAREILWIVIASVLTAFDIRDAVDTKGQPLECDKIEYSSGVLSKAPHIRCRLQLRPEMSAAMILGASDS